MILSKVLSKNQITLPSEAVRKLHISKGDILKCEVHGKSISFIPVIVEEPYSEEELKKFDELYNRPTNKGKSYHSKSEAVGHLRRLKRA